MAQLGPDDDEQLPYENLDDLPPQVSRLPIHRQEMWMSAYNAYLDEFGDKEQADRTAWIEATRGYAPEEEERPGRHPTHGAGKGH